MKRIRIPYFYQKTDYTCGPTAMQMAMEFFHKHISQKRLAQAMHTSKKYGTSHSSMIRAAQKAKLYSYVNEQSTIHEIKHFIHLNIPVIVDFIEPTGEEGHYAVVSGYTKNALVLNDPWNGKNVHMAYALFSKRWHDRAKNHTYPHWIMAVSNSDFQLGRQYKPKK